jgi:hypothetical protein
MIQKLKVAILSLCSLFIFSAPLIMVTPSALAQSPNIQGSLCSGADKLQVNQSPTDCRSLDQSGANDPNALIRKIINILSVIVGIIAVIMIIIGGFRYITSGGASEKVTGAKNTLLYAIIGLIIVALAQVIVRFVLRNTT